MCIYLMLSVILIISLSLMPVGSCVRSDNPGKLLLRIVTNNPIANIFRNSYSFFYNLPKKNVLYDIPAQLFVNSTSEFIAWYQFPHNLPPYRYVGEELLPKDFFCWGLPGATLPVGNWVNFYLIIIHVKLLELQL